MDFLVPIFPGFAFSVFIFLNVIAIFHGIYYLKYGYKRSKTIMLFSSLISLAALGHTFVQPRVFNPEFLYWLALVIFLSNSVYRYYYYQSLKFFIAIPKRVLFPCNIALFSLGVMTAVPFIAKVFFGKEYFFNHDIKQPIGNYFADSYGLQLGKPFDYVIVLIALFSIIDLIMAVYLYGRVKRSSNDPWFKMGLLFTIFVCLDQVLSQFTLDYYIPLFFFSNFFEAARMTVLSIQEFAVVSDRELLDSEKQNSEETKKYQNSNLSEERIEELVAKLNDIMLNDNVYKDPNLRSDKLARMLGVPVYQLSQVINNGLNLHFNDLVNDYRIKHIMSSLQKGQAKNLNIIDIAYGAGFNSKSTFNKAFKRVAGMTPSEYRKIHEE